MKTDTHPQLNPVVFLDTSSGVEYITTSTLTSEETKKINGVDHFVIKVEISSSSHPFYTGKRKLVDTAGRVDKFLEKVKKAQKIKATQVKKVDKELDELLEEKADEASSKAKKEPEKKEKAPKKEVKAKAEKKPAKKAEKATKKEPAAKAAKKEAK